MCSMYPEILKKMCKKPIIDSVMEWEKLLEEWQKKKKAKLTGKNYLVNATLVGKKDAICTLIIADGDLVKNRAIAGLGKDMCHRYGVRSSARETQDRETQDRKETEEKQGM